MPVLRQIQIENQTLIKIHKARIKTPIKSLIQTPKRAKIKSQTPIKILTISLNLNLNTIIITITTTLIKNLLNQITKILSQTIAKIVILKTEEKTSLLSMI